MMYDGEESNRLTFIIPTYNILSNEEAHQRALTGFTNFSELENVDIIVSDYGSTDKTKEVIESFGFTYLYTRRNKDEHFNFCKCANNGIAEAKTKYICILGFDWLVGKGVPKAIVDKFNSSDDNVFVQIGSTDKVRNVIWQQLSLKRKHAITSYGYDERFNTWGTEDKDFIARLTAVNKLKRLQLPKEFCITHLSHDFFWRKKGEPGNDAKYKRNKKELHNEIVNSYWKPKTNMYEV